jgi:hypothetical protein
MALIPSGLELPQLLARVGAERDELAGLLAGEQQAAARGEHADHI